MDQGSILFLDRLARVDDGALSGPTALPGWTGRHVVAHVAANADALLNLAHWAASGRETPMYASPEQRNADIESGAQRTPEELRGWVHESAERLASALAGLSSDQWSREVRTAQGRLLPATEIPWLRAREVTVHAVDLDSGLGFEDLPEDFLLALIDDVVAKRSAVADHPPLVLQVADRPAWTVAGPGKPADVRGSAAGIAAYVTGRAGAEVTSGAPVLPAWL